MIVLFAGFYFLTGESNAREKAPDLRLPNGKLPESFYLTVTGLVLLAISGILAGALYVGLARSERVTSNIPLAMAAGATTGLLIFLLTSLATLAGAFDGGPAGAISTMFTGAFDTAPVFILIMLLLALFAAAGATACRLALLAIAKLRSG